MTMLLSILLSSTLLLAPAAGAPSRAPATAQHIAQEEAPPTDDKEGPVERAKRLAEKRKQDAAQAHDREKQASVLRDADGNPIEPGVLPARTTPTAAQAWSGITEATGFRKAIASFDLRFHLFLRQSDANNEVDAHLRFLAPRYISAALGSGRRHLRGPEGDYLIDDKEVIRLVGREGKEDRKQIDRTVSLARNFVSLVDPSKLRILELVELDGPPDGLPADLKPSSHSGYTQKSVLELGTGLRWISLRSPDFELEKATRGKRATIRSCLIGYSPETMDVQIAVIQADRGDTPRRDIDRHASGTLLVILGRHARRKDDGVRVPLWIGIHDVVDPREGRFRKRPGSELIMNGDRGSFHAELKPEDFLPPTQ